MSAITPTFRPANLLLIASIILFGAVAASGPPPPDAGTCIDPNGKPRPCDESEVAPPGAQRQPELSAPRD